MLWETIWHFVIKSNTHLPGDPEHPLLGRGSASFTSPPAAWESSSCSPFSPTMGIASLCHSNVCVCYLIVVLITFFWWLVMFNIFSCAYWPFVHLLGNVCSNLVQIFSGWLDLLNCRSPLDILDNSLLSNTIHVLVLGIFSPSAWIIFSFFWMASSKERKFLMLMNSSLSTLQNILGFWCST